MAETIIELQPSQPQLGQTDGEDATGTEDLSQLTLEELRAAKSACDNDIIDALARRQTITDIIGVRKTEQGSPVRVISEEHRVLAEIGLAAKERGLSPRTITALWVNLFEDSRTRQMERRKALGTIAVHS